MIDGVTWQSTVNHTLLLRGVWLLCWKQTDTDFYEGIGFAAIKIVNDLPSGVLMTQQLIKGLPLLCGAFW